MSTKRTASEVLKDARKLVVERMKRGGVHRGEDVVAKQQIRSNKKDFYGAQQTSTSSSSTTPTSAFGRIENARKTLNEYWSSFSSSNSKLSRRTQQQRLNQQNHPTTEAEAGVEGGGSSAPSSYFFNPYWQKTEQVIDLSLIHI